MRWLYGFVRPHAARLALILVLSAASTLLALAQPYLTKFLIDDGLLARELRVVIIVCALMVGAALLAAGLGALNRWHYVDVSAVILFALREHVFAHLARLSPRFYQRTRGGDVIARLDGDVAEVQRFAVDTLLASFNGVLALGGALALMLSLSWQLTLLAFVLLPVNFLFLRFMRPRVETRTRIVREGAGAILSFFVDALAAMKLIQSSAAQAREARQLAGLHDRYRRDTLALQMINYAAATVPGLLITLSTAVVFVYGGYLVIGGALSLGSLIAFSVYLARAGGPVQTLQGLYVAWQRARVSLARVEALTHSPADVEEAPGAVAPARDGAGAIRFDAVSFSHGGERLLDAVDFSVPGGAKLVIAGPSGAGKSTLADLLQRHYDPDDGAILLDGIDLRQLRLAALRRCVAVVAQDLMLIPGSVLDNVRYANPQADDQAVRQALQAARVDAFLDQLPQREHTEVGPRGCALSGGQRQRIGIARALLQAPRVLVLDEATSGIDAATEREVIASIDRLFTRCTRIVITHRPERVTDADLRFELLPGGVLRPLPGGAPA